MSLGQQEICEKYNVKYDVNAFYKEIEIRFYDCDSSHRARPETLLRYAADVAGIAYADKGYSHQWLLDNGFVFLLSRLAIGVQRMPMADESILLETWEREVKGVLFYRDVVFHSRSGEAIVSCDTAWSLVNPNARTIIKPASFVGRIDPHPDKRKADCPEAQRLKENSNLAHCGTREIVYSDIDGNGHVYNAVYAGISCDVLPVTFTLRPLSSLQINFKQETLFGEALDIFSNMEPEENAATVIGKNGETISYICRLEVAP